VHAVSHRVFDLVSRWGLALLACALPALAPASDADDPGSWVMSMNRMLANASYDGVFVHQIG